MKILQVTEPNRERYFLFESGRDEENIALKLLNERRIFDTDEGKLKQFIEYVTTEQDGSLAVDLLVRLYDVEVHTPEVV